MNFVHSVLSLGCLVVVILSWQGAHGEGPELSHLQYVFKENEEPGLMVCVYYAAKCKRDSQVCSPKFKKCQDIQMPDINFKEATDEQKCSACQKFISEYKTYDENTHGYYDACLYIIGKLVAEKKAACSGMGLGLRKSIGFDLCPYRNAQNQPVSSQCKLGEEFCSETGCQALFAPNTSDKDKGKQCFAIIKHNKSLKADACLYVLGLLDSQKGDQGESTSANPSCHESQDSDKDVIESTSANPPCHESQDSDKDVIIKVLASLVGLFGVGIVAIVVGVCWQNKWACFKTQEPQKPDPNSKARGDDRDVRKPLSQQGFYLRDPGNEGRDNNDNLDVPVNKRR